MYKIKLGEKVMKIFLSDTQNEELLCHVTPEREPSNPDHALFVSDLKDNREKKLFGLLLFEGTFTSFFKDQKSKRSHSKNQCCGSGSGIRDPVPF